MFSLPSSRTLVLSERHTPDSVALWRVAVFSGTDVVRARYGCPLTVRSPPFLYGETLFADAMCDSLGIDVLGPDDTWLPGVPDCFLSRRVELRALGDVLSDNSAFPLFVKPPDDKFFPARVYFSARDLADVTPGFDFSTLVLVSGIVNFDVEWRAFVAHGRAVALSAYVRHGVLVDDWDGPPDEREAAQEFLAGLLASPSLSLPPVMVIDVGRLPDGTWAVVEGNPAWASGLCGCEPEVVFLALMDATVPAGAGGRWARRVVWTSQV